ncbi:MAG: hypothetical protein FWD50_07840 [Betaproteobacteria bacterium]|nr:hypothetical protein [Betaproteobacteria bacterium]
MPPRPEQAADDSQPICRHCQHYTITHDPDFRYGCRVLGFKSRHPPCRDVISASGEPCLYFMPKSTAKGTDPR